MLSVAQSKFMALLSVLAVAAFVGTTGQAQQPARPAAAQAQPNFANVEVQTLHVQGNVYMAVGGPFNAAFSVGDDGVLVVDTMVEPLADKLIEAIRKVAGTKPIRYVFNTHWHQDHTGGNVKVADAGQSVVSGNFAGQAGAAQAERAFIWAHENALHRMSQTEGKPNAIPVAAWPTDAYFTDRKEIYFNGEAVQLLSMPNAHTDGDSIVFFRKSDVIVAGDIYVNTSYPIFALDQGGSFNGLLSALNSIIELTVPRDKQEGGTYVMPGHGRLVDEADVVEFRDMVTIVRDRVQDLMKKKQTLAQIKAARPSRDYDGEYSAGRPADEFVESIYRSLGGKP